MGLSQSQYSRREKGKIRFVMDEVQKLSQLLETTVAELFGEETTVFSNNNQKGGVFGQYVSVPEKLIEQYEVRLKEKDDLINLLKQQLNL
ncbi:MAG: helix-turn-helix transcriptional regulator [Flavobacteriaceae bacterium]|nr:helix-turn-helix transcriptional regulator [Flavobacteriaceae bacterium]